MARRILSRSSRRRILKRFPVRTLRHLLVVSKRPVARRGRDSSDDLDLVRGYRDTLFVDDACAKVALQLGRIRCSSMSGSGEIPV